MSETPHNHLQEFDKDEWYDVCKRIKPDLTYDEYEVMWQEFQNMKADRKFREGLQ